MREEIVLEHVTKRFPPSTLALDDVSLTVRSGESLSIVGPSGSGKSTLLAVLGLLEQPDSGTRIVAGIETGGAKDSALTRLRREHLAFVFQSFHLLDHLTVTENVLHALDIRERDRAGHLARAEEALVSVGLGHRLGAFPPTLSGGERQRVAIARALASRPRVLLCDEPTGNLDTVTAGSVLELLLEQAAAGIGVVIVTHSQEVASRCDRVVRVVDGKVSDDSP